jgi:hypothetical protein
MRTLLVMIGAWFVLNVFLVVAAINDKAAVMGQLLVLHEHSHWTRD